VHKCVLPGCGGEVVQVPTKNGIPVGSQEIPRLYDLGASGARNSKVQWGRIFFCNRCKLMYYGFPPEDFSPKIEEP